MSVLRSPAIGPDTAVYCADPGSIKAGNFGWYGTANGSSRQGRDPETLVMALADALATGCPVLLGFECPLWMPLPDNGIQLGKARVGEGNRPWSAGAGATIATYGLVQLAWVLRELRRERPNDMYLDRPTDGGFRPGLYLFEAFVSGKSKAKGADGHVGDAKRAVDKLMMSGAVDLAHQSSKAEVISTVGAALIRTGWTSDLRALRRAVPIVFVEPLT